MKKLSFFVLAVLICLTSLFSKGVYEKAADADASGTITVADLTPIMSASVGNADVISQTR